MGDNMLRTLGPSYLT